MRAASLVVLLLCGAARAEERPTGKVGQAWLSAQAVGDSRRVLWRVDDSTFRGQGGALEVRAVTADDQQRFEVRLGELAGTFTLRREGGATVVQGAWTKPLPEPVLVRLDRQRLDISWGARERHLEQLEAPQLPEDCLHYAQTSPSVEVDRLDVCGAVVWGLSPPLQTLVALLLQSPERGPPPAYTFRSRSRPKDPPPQNPRPRTNVDVNR